MRDTSRGLGMSDPRGDSERQLSRGGSRKRKMYRAMEVDRVHTGARQGLPRVG